MTRLNRVRIGLHWLGLDWIKGSDWVPALDWIGLTKLDLVGLGLGWNGLDWAGIGLEVWTGTRLGRFVWAGTQSVASASLFHIKTCIIIV